MESHQKIISFSSGRRRGAAKVVFVVGGAEADCAAHPGVLGADLVMYLDVPKEISAAKPDKTVITVALGKGQTVGTLALKNCPEKLRRFFRARPGINLENGLGQLAAVGRLLAKALVKKHWFRALMARCYDRLRILHNGTLHSIEVVVASSIAGGTGAAVGPVVARAFTDFVLPRTSASVEIVLFRVGPLTYLGLGDRIHLNAAATLAEDIDYVTSPDRHPRETRGGIFFELPIVGDHKAERDQFATQLTQALRSSAVNEFLQRDGVNVAVGSEIGTVTIVRASWGKGLSPRAVASEVAAEYLARVDVLRRTPALEGFVHGVSVELEGEETARVSEEALLAEIRRTPGEPPGLAERAKQPPTRYDRSIVKVAVLQDTFGESGELNFEGGFPPFLRKPATSEAEFAQRIGALRALHAELAGEITSRHGRLVALEAREAANERRLVRTVAAYHGLLANKAKRLVQLRKALHDCRREADELARLRVELAALADARKLTGDSLKRELKRLEGVAGILDNLRGGREPGIGTGNVEVEALDLVLSELLDATLEDVVDEAALASTLASCARRVTLDGLARITGAAEASVEKIAAALQRKPRETCGPNWGGADPTSPGRAITVLPPLAPVLLDEIRGFAADGASSGGLHLVQADSAEGGVNVVDLEIVRPQAKTDIFTSDMRQSLREAEVHRELYFDEDLDLGRFWRWLELDPGRIEHVEADERGDVGIEDDAASADAGDAAA